MRSSARQIAGGIVGLVMVVSAVTSCTNSTESFCTDFAKQADLAELVAALDKGDLAAARKQADALGALADSAPHEIRVDFQTLTQSVIDIIRLLDEDRKAGSVSESHSENTTEADQIRKDLNDRFDDLDERSRKVGIWAANECGMDLT